jgi:hypothetical protein
LIEFTADLKDRKFSSVKILIDEENVTVDDITYNLDKIRDVKLVEGFGYNYIEIDYAGERITLCEFTNGKKEEMLKLYEILKSTRGKTTSR